MNRLFEIQTLSENGNGGGGMDPVTIGMAAYSIFNSVFPRLFGGRSLEQIAIDERNAVVATRNSFFSIYGIMLPDQMIIGLLQPIWNAGGGGTQQWQKMVTFYNQNKASLEEAKRKSQNLPPGGVSGGVYTAGMPSMLTGIIIGGVVLVLIMKKKKK